MNIRNFLWLFVLPFVIGILLQVSCTLFGVNVDPPKSGDKVDIFVTNNTDLPVTAQVQAGLLSRQIDLEPGQTRNFWAPKGLIPETVSVKLVIRQGRPR